MKTKYYYIHGLGSSKESSKFKELQKQYDNIECLEWTINNNIDMLIGKWSHYIKNEINNFDNICVIASSTGANFAHQLKLLCSKNNIYLHLVLLNPLFDIQSLYDKNIIPNQLTTYIEKVNKIDNSLILIGLLDNVVNTIGYINNENTYIRNNNQVVIDVNGTHKFENLNQYYSVIDKYINSLNI